MDMCDASHYCYRGSEFWVLGLGLWVSGFLGFGSQLLGFEFWEWVSWGCRLCIRDRGTWSLQATLMILCAIHSRQKEAFSAIANGAIKLATTLNIFRFVGRLFVFQLQKNNTEQRILEFVISFK